MSTPNTNELDGCGLIAAERRRQIEKEGYTEAHDDEHTLGELSEAATCYVVLGSATVRGSSAAEWPADMLNGFNDSIVEWPWDEEWWKPSNDPVRNLVKAGALIAAEIDRIRRLKRGIGRGAKHPTTPLLPTLSCSDEPQMESEAGEPPISAPVSGSPNAQGVDGKTQSEISGQAAETQCAIPPRAEGRPERPEGARWGNEALSSGEDASHE